MKALKIVLIVIGLAVGLNLIMTGINILQKGSAKRDGRSIEQILGIPVEKATAADIEKLGKADVFQLYYAASAPDFKAMNGEYRCKNLSVGVQAVPTNLYTNHVFGPGRWVGKAFTPAGKNKGWGYNIFSAKGDDPALSAGEKAGKKVFFRTRKMDTGISPSKIDGKPSFCIDYSPYNGGTVNSMKDELRKINDRLYLGMGYMALGGGSINPAPFIVIGPAEKWVGIDEQ